jgi:hypothetical protein
MRRTRWRLPWLAILGVLLVVAGMVGTIVWLGAFSPYGFVRFALPRPDHTITISRPGTYLVFEEFAGAARRDLPSPIDISVTPSVGYPALPVEPLVEPGERGAPLAYNVPPNEGRAIARFVAPRPGRYLLMVDTIAPEQADAPLYRDQLPEGLAVGRELGAAWLRTPIGLALFGLLPLAAGTTVLVVVVVRRRGRSARPHRGAPPAVL